MQLHYKYVSRGDRKLFWIISQEKISSLLRCIAIGKTEVKSNAHPQITNSDIYLRGRDASRDGFVCDVYRDDAMSIERAKLIAFT